MAQGSPDAREKLGGADRLGQIIIRAEVERTYLSCSCVRAERTMIGTLDQVRTWRMISMPSMSGSPRSRRIRSGHWDVMIGSASFPVCAVEMR